MVVRRTKNNSRSQKEELEKRTYKKFEEAFYNFYENKLNVYDHDVLFAYNKKVDQHNVWAYFDFNKRYGSLMVYLNFKLVDQKKNILELTAQRMALKIAMYKNGMDFHETSEDYINMCAQYKLWNYMGYAETPQKMHIYKCTICGRPMAVFPKRLPNNNELTSKMKTPWHNKSLKSTEAGGTVHQGGYAYSGNEEINNDELQQILYIMKKSVEFTNNFTDNRLKVKQYNEDNFDDFAEDDY